MKFFTFLFIPLFILPACTDPKEQASVETPPFDAVFHTTQGDFTITFHPDWAPIGVAHVRKLIASDFYRDIAIFRVVPDFVVQFGIHDDSTLNKKWIANQIQDEPVRQPNQQWTVAFARDGAHTRDTQLFINLKNNSPRLDTINYLGSTGFPVIGEVTAGTEMIEKFYGEYGNAPAMEQDSIYQMGNAYLKRKYPKLDYITSVEISGE